MPKFNFWHVVHKTEAVAEFSIGIGWVKRQVQPAAIFFSIWWVLIFFFHITKSQHEKRAQYEKLFDQSRIRPSRDLKRLGLAYLCWIVHHRPCSNNTTAFLFGLFINAYAHQKQLKKKIVLIKRDGFHFTMHDFFFVMYKRDSRMDIVGRKDAPVVPFTRTQL
jgi:hypothetical protein